MVFEKNDSFIELLVINWRLEYQPILDKVNKNKIPWMLLDDLHLISLNTVLKKMKVKNITEDKKELVFLWHKLEPWKDSSKYLKLLGRKYVTSSLSNGNISLQKICLNMQILTLTLLFLQKILKSISLIL